VALLDNIWLIISINQDPDLPSTKSKNQVKIGAFWKLYFVKLLFIALAISVPVSTANAGVFSFISNLLGLSEKYEAVALTASIHNSQTVPLPKAALNSDPNPSKGGGEIAIVGGTSLLSETGPSGTLADIGEVKTSDQISIYVVREGDSLSQIAKMFSVSVNTIVWANDNIRHGSLITPGQTLVILPVTGIRHTVASGDTLKGIAKKYDGNLDEILQYNNLNVDAVLAVGDVIVVPDGEIAAPAYSQSNANVIVKGAGGPSYNEYYIKPVSGKRSQGLHGYNAVDIATPAGTPIVASASGDVIISRGSGWNGGYGNYIVIKHDNGTQTLYAHNSSNIVYSGQRVVQGQVIGYVGSTGRSTGSHVHFEIRGAQNPF
jgi:LysM repeat protein